MTRSRRCSGRCRASERRAPRRPSGSSATGEPFPTADGRARFVPTPYRPPAAAADERLPLLLNTGRIRDQWHTMTRTGRLPRLMAHQREPLLDIHPR